VVAFCTEQRNHFAHGSSRCSGVTFEANGASLQKQVCFCFLQLLVTLPARAVKDGEAVVNTSNFTAARRCSVAPCRDLGRI
jgi:hypothetical protein